MSWDELVATALIGTDRRSVPADAPPGAPPELAAALERRGVEDRLLTAAAAWTVARRAGAQPAAAVAAAPAEEDPRPVCSPAAGARLATLLDGQEGLVRQWLARAAERGLRPPPELVPALLDFAVDAVVVEAAGPLGRWLAARNPEWAFAGGEWADASSEARQLIFERLRGTDPAAARELLAPTFADEPWLERERYISAFQQGLSDADEPFLEAALDDGRKPVRQAAAERLAELPRSRFAARMAERARPLLRVEDRELTVTLPGEPDAAARRDDLEPGGRRSQRLSELLAAAPLDTWPLAYASLPVRNDLGPAVYAGWAEAALRQRNPDWARALWRDDPRLLRVLPAGEGDTLAAAADDPLAAARALGRPWGLALSRAVVEAICRTPEADPGATGLFIDPTVEVESLRELGGPRLWRLCDLVATRAAMLRELDDRSPPARRAAVRG